MFFDAGFLDYVNSLREKYVRSMIVRSYYLCELIFHTFNALAVIRMRPKVLHKFASNNATEAEKFSN